jgi:hypothetical protein
MFSTSKQFFMKKIRKKFKKERFPRPVHGTDVGESYPHCSGRELKFRMVFHRFQMIPIFLMCGMVLIPWFIRGPLPTWSPIQMFTVFVCYVL